MRFEVGFGLLAVFCACSSSSGGAAVTDAGGGGGEDASEAAACTNKPQSNNGGSCTEPGVDTDGGDADIPPIFCIDYTGSAQMAAGAMQSCKTMVHTFSSSPCATVAAGATPVGFCIRSCGTTQETVQYYYSAASAVDAQTQCQSIMGDVWVAQ
jgi:hypothetical protein